MNLKTVKSIESIKLVGIEIDWIKEDNMCREVRLTDSAGFTLVVRAQGGYGESLKVLRLAAENEKDDRGL